MGHSCTVDDFGGRGCRIIQLSINNITTLSRERSSRTTTQRVGTTYRGSRTIYASLGGRGGATTPPGLFSLATLRQRTGHLCKFATGRALSCTRTLCRGQLLACPHASDGCVASSVRNDAGRLVANLYTTLPFVRNIGLRTSLTEVYSGDGMASRRTVLPATRFIGANFSSLTRDRGGLVALIYTGLLYTITTPCRCRTIATIFAYNNCAFATGNEAALYRN